MQSKNAQGFSASNLGTSGGSAPTYWDKNKGRSFEGQMEKYTKICAFVFFVVTLILNVIK
jgi:preprotein translocase subunit SecG